MSEIVDFLNVQLDKDAVNATMRAIHRETCESVLDAEGYTYPCTCGVPERLMREVESKRQIVREVMSWRHEVVDGDCWFTCGAATEERDGGECCNDNQRNECTCGLDDRREKFLSLLAAPFSGEPGYDAERWAA